MRKEFVINDLLSVRFNPETGKTEVYVDGELFRQCKYILLVSPNETISNEINSIDEAAEQMSHVLEKELKPSDFGITPLEEFQAHCSNLQAWAENDYDTRLLHSNLAFPLLAKLAWKGDALAQARFKGQVAARFIEGTRAIRQFILEQEYLWDFTDEELLALYDGILCDRDAEALRNLYKDLVPYYEDDDDNRGVVPLYSYNERDAFTEEDGTIRTLTFDLGDEHHLYAPDYDYERVAEAIFSLKELRSLDLTSNYFTDLPERFGELKRLKKLHLTACKEIPESISELQQLEYLSISICKGPIPESISKLQQLQHLYIGACKGTIPDSIGKLKQLRTLTISSNQDMTSLPESIGNLTQLEELTINDNPELTSLPKSLKKLENLRLLEISGERIENIDLPEHCSHLTELTLSSTLLERVPEQVWNYRYLKVLRIKKTQISELPENIINLGRLITLWLSDNLLESLPTVLEPLPLKYISIDNNPLKSFPTFLFKIRTLRTIYSDEEQVKLLDGAEIPGFKISKDYTISRL